MGDEGVNSNGEIPITPNSDEKSVTNDQKIEDVGILRDSDHKEPQQTKFTNIQPDHETVVGNPIEKDIDSVKLMKELVGCRERETRLKRECERLRAHLVQTEDRYTREALEAEEREEEMRKSLTALRHEMVSSSTDILNAKSSAARQVESLRIQLNLAMEQKDNALQNLAAAEETISSYSSSLANLQMVLEQFQDETRHNQSAEFEMCQTDLEKERLTTRNLRSEKIDLQKKLDEITIIANSTHHFKHQISENEKEIALLQTKLEEQEEEFSEAKTKWQQFSASSEDRIDRLLTKNLLMGFIHTPPAKRSEAFTVVGHILGFTDAELESIGVHNSGSWLSGLFRNAAATSPDAGSLANSNYSFSELFIRFLEKESSPLPQPKLPLERMAHEHQQNYQLPSFLLPPITPHISSTPETSTEKFAAYPHSTISSIFPVEQSNQFVVDCKKFDIGSSEIGSSEIGSSEIGSSELHESVTQTGNSDIFNSATPSILVD